MKALHMRELQNLACVLEQELPARLQKVLEAPFGMVWELWSRKRGVFYWAIDLRPSSPLVLPLRQPWSKKKRLSKPMGLFLRAHAEGKCLWRVKVLEEWGRVLHLEMGKCSEAQREGVVELRLFPHGQNMLAFFEGKKVSWSKVTELKPVDGVEEEDRGFRTLEELQEEWEASFQTAQTKKDDPQKLRQKEIQKQTKLLKRLQEEFEKEGEWGRLGSWLLSHQTLAVPEKWNRLINATKSFSWNLERVFEKAKKEKRKKERLQERIQKVEQTLQALESGEEKNLSPIEKNRKELWFKEKVKSRYWALNDSSVVYRGRSAKDNLALLRNAKPWFYWLHIKDQPGAYGIVTRHRNQRVGEVELHKAAQWLLKESIKGAQGVYEVLVAECRYVRPIKGDHLGRVTYQKERVLRVKIG